MHWSQLVGGDIVISPPFAWQMRLNASGIEPVPRIDEPVAKPVIETLYSAFPDFRRAIDTDGMTIEEFEQYGASRQTLRQFLNACAELELLVRDVLLPDPQLK
jgi:transaldolase